MGQFFINRPIFAWVLAILTLFAGGLAISVLPVAQYPDIALPQIAVSGQYPGASATTVDQSVVQVIERQMKGLDNLLYMRSSSDDFGNLEIYFTFDAGTNPDTAQVQVQNKLQIAAPQLPESVQRQGLQVAKSTANSFMNVAFYSANDSMRPNDISDYVSSNILDQLSRVQGVGMTVLYAGQNAMRIWCDPEKMRRYKLNPEDVIIAIEGQNAQVGGGQTGAAPALPGQQMTFTVSGAERLQTVDEFRNIRIKVEEDGSVLRLGDIARIELNEESFTGSSHYNGMPSATVALRLAGGANVLETSRLVKAELASLARFFPPGLTYDFAEDRAPIVEKSIWAVVRTLIEAIVLVVAVMFLFMQSIRATFIPAIAVPVVLAGVFAVLAAAGFSINTLTMFGMVLSIGLLVDDAIVVVENVERLMHTDAIPPKDAAAITMRQITGALVGVAVVIGAVFLPMAFMGGSIGVIYRQFSITIISAMTISVLVAVVLTPALCATMLRNAAQMAQIGIFGAFNRGFEKLSRMYSISLRKILRKPRRWLALYIFVCACCVVLFLMLPTAFLPAEDMGTLYVDVQLPPGATFERTEKILHEIDQYFREEEKDAVRSVLLVQGWGLSGSGQGSAMVIPKLKDWSQRGEGQSAFDVMRRANKKFANIPGAKIVVVAPPAVRELGTSSGFDMELMDRSGKGHASLLDARDSLLKAAGKRSEIANARYSGPEDAEQYKLAIDVDKAGALGLSKNVINDAIEAYWGGRYINDFSDNGRTKKVYFQAEPAFRTSARDFGRYHIRNLKGEMVPFSSFLEVKSTIGAPKLTRYQGVPSVKIEGTATEGKSSGDAMLAMEECAATLPSGCDFAWTGLSYQEKFSGGKAPILYAISIVVVFLCLAALYESWSIPFAVLLTMPTGIIGALAGMMMRGMHNDIYFQIAILTIVGLSAKNSILIVEFARDLYKNGQSIVHATVEAARLRLRPILMTSLCFILGVIPLAVSSGAGSGAQNALGTAVMAGMVTATCLGIYYTPLFFVIVTLASEKTKRHPDLNLEKTLPNTD